MALSPPSNPPWGLSPEPGLHPRPPEPGPPLPPSLLPVARIHFPPRNTSLRVRKKGRREETPKGRSSPGGYSLGKSQEGAQLGLELYSG